MAAALVVITFVVIAFLVVNTTMPFFLDLMVQVERWAHRNERTRAHLVCSAAKNRARIRFFSER